MYSGSPSDLEPREDAIRRQVKSRAAKNASGSLSLIRCCAQIHCASPVMSKNLREYVRSRCANAAVNDEDERQHDASGASSGRGRSVLTIESPAVMRSVIVIPARWASTRFPGKPLAPIAGVSLIRRVYERAAQSQRAEAVYVATDDDRIERARRASSAAKSLRPRATSRPAPIASPPRCGSSRRSRSTSS